MTPGRPFAGQGGYKNQNTQRQKRQKIRWHGAKVAQGQELLNARSRLETREWNSQKIVKNKLFKLSCNHLIFAAYIKFTR